MKKSYIKPECEVLTMLPSTVLALSAKYSDEETTSGSQCLSNGRRGHWGNLWDEE